MRVNFKNVKAITAEIARAQASMQALINRLKEADRK